MISNLWQYLLLLGIGLFLILGAVAHLSIGVPLYLVLLYGLPLFLIVPFVWAITLPFRHTYTIWDGGDEISIAKETGSNIIAVGESLLRIPKAKIKGFARVHKFFPLYRLSFGEDVPLQNVSPNEKGIRFFSFLPEIEIHEILVHKTGRARTTALVDFILNIPPEGVKLGERLFLDLPPAGIGRLLSFLDSRTVGYILIALSLFGWVYSVLLLHESGGTSELLVLLLVSGFILVFYGRKQVDVFLKGGMMTLMSGSTETSVPLSHLSQVFFKNLTEGFYCILRFNPPTEFGSQIEFHTNVPLEILQGLQSIANGNGRRHSSE